MARHVWQWCAYHKAMEDYPACATTHTLNNFTRAQVGEKEATAVAIHPGTGEVVYCFGDDPAKPLPEQWRNQGFEKKQFHSFRELQKFCRATGQVNDIEGDWHKDDGYFEEDLSRRRKIEKEQRERYMDERQKVLQAYPELRNRR